MLKTAHINLGLQPYADLTLKPPYSPRIANICASFVFWQSVSLGIPKSCLIPSILGLSILI